MWDEGVENDNDTGLAGDLVGDESDLEGCARVGGDCGAGNDMFKVMVGLPAMLPASESLLCADRAELFRPWLTPR